MFKAIEIESDPAQIKLDDTRRARWPFRDLLCRVSTKISYVREVQHDYAIMM